MTKETPGWEEDPENRNKLMFSSRSSNSYQPEEQKDLWFLSFTWKCLFWCRSCAEDLQSYGEPLSRKQTQQLLLFGPPQS